MVSGLANAVKRALLKVFDVVINYVAWWTPSSVNFDIYCWSVFIHFKCILRQWRRSNEYRSTQICLEFVEWNVNSGGLSRMA